MPFETALATGAGAAGSDMTVVVKKSWYLEW